VDMWLRRVAYDGSELLRPRGGRYWFHNGVHVQALVAWAAGMIAAFFLTNSARWQSPISTHVLDGADLSIPVGMLVAGLAYYALAKGTIARSSEPTPAPDRGSEPYMPTQVLHD
jgi:NCS1 family nucleobase:cation symporter-1